MACGCPERRPGAARVERRSQEPRTGRAADEPRAVQAVAVHAEPRVVHAGLAHELHRQRRAQRRHRPPRPGGARRQERRDAVRRAGADDALLGEPCRAGQATEPSHVQQLGEDEDDQEFEGWEGAIADEVVILPN